MESLKLSKANISLRRFILYSEWESPLTTTESLLYPLLHSVLTRHMGISSRALGSGDSATFVAAFTRPIHACSDNFLRHLFEVLGQTQEAHGVYEGRGEIELDSKLTGGVVERECVVVVVEAFPWKPKWKTLVFW